MYFPENTDEVNSDIFYGINTFTDGNNHNSEISFGYDETMFPSILNFNPASLKLYLFQNNTTQEVPSALGTSSKTLEINTNFKDESYVYFAYQTASLSSNSNTLNDAIFIYPNPIYSELNITSNLLKNNFNVNIVNMLVAEILSTKNSNKINVCVLKSGI